jgi:hypothetical protein
VGGELSIMEVTVKMHRSNAVRKLRVKSVAKLARIARGSQYPVVMAALEVVQDGWNLRIPRRPIETYPKGWA